MSQATILTGDCLDILPTLDAGSVQCCVTSPPYWGLRDYGVEGQLGLERSPEEYVAKMVRVFAEVQRVLRDDGVLWLNLGDSYSDSRAGAQGKNGQMANRSVAAARCRVRGETRAISGLAGKNLVGIPWRVAFALQADGWYLRSDIIWAKPNPMPESVTDRPTKSHEYLFLLSKSGKYYYDSDAIAEPVVSDEKTIQRGKVLGSPQQDQSGGFPVRDKNNPERNARSVWPIATQPYTGAHFATFPEELARRCIMAGSKPGDTVLDPFGGSGTVGQVATGNARNALLIELNPKYVELARQRIGPMLCA